MYVASFPGKRQKLCRGLGTKLEVISSFMKRMKTGWGTIEDSQKTDSKRTVNLSSPLVL